MYRGTRPARERVTRRCVRLLGMAERKRARRADEDTVAAKRLRSDMLEVFQCPITFSLPDDNFMAEDGKVYERAAIEAWLARTADRKVKSPFTGLPMGRKLTEASQVRNLIKRLHEEETSEVKEEADVVPVAAAVAAPPAVVAAGPAAIAAPLAVRVKRVLCSHCTGFGAFYDRKPRTKSCITTDYNLCDGTGRAVPGVEPCSHCEGHGAFFNRKPRGPRAASPRTATCATGPESRRTTSNDHFEGVGGGRLRSGCRAPTARDLVYAKLVHTYAARAMHAAAGTRLERARVRGASSVTRH